MEYNYKDNTLLHGIGFNFERFESILEYGILSKKEALEKKISYTKNYQRDDYRDEFISLVRVGDISLDNSNLSAYQIHSCYGINFIIEDTLYYDEREKLNIHHFDEVFVKDRIPFENIKGIAIPYEYQEMSVAKVDLIPANITSYRNICDIVLSYLKYLEHYQIAVDREDINEFLNEIFLINKALYSISSKKDNEEELKELLADYYEVIRELNEYLGAYTYKCFKNILGEKPTIKNICKFLLKGRLEIYDIPFNNLENSRKIS